MSSPPSDPHPSSEHQPSPSEPSVPERAALLASIRTRGRALRRRRRLAGAAGLASILVLVGVIGVVQADEGRPPVAVVAGGGDESTTSSEADPSTTAPPTSHTTIEGGGSTTETSLEPPPTTSTVAPGGEGGGDETTTTTSGLVCRNSIDPACGPTYWDPIPPEDQPLVLELLNSLDGVTVDTDITIEVRLRDADAYGACGSVMIVDENGNSAWDRITMVTPSGGCPAVGCSRLAHGPWDPPAPGPGFDRVETTIVRIHEPGTYRVRAWFYSARLCYTEIDINSETEIVVPFTVVPGY